MSFSTRTTTITSKKEANPKQNQYFLKASCVKVEKSWKKT